MRSPEEFINDLANAKGLKQYDMLRSTLYEMGLPFSEDEIDEIYMQFIETGDLPDFIFDYAEA